MPMNKIIAWFRIIMLQSNPKSNKSTIFYLCFTRKSNLIGYTAICTAEISFIKREISLLHVDIWVYSKEILLYDKNSCVITAQSCCRYRQFKGILFHEKGNPSTHGEEILFCDTYQRRFLEELSFVTHI